VRTIYRVQGVADAEVGRRPREHENAWERYDYTYRDEELLEWVPRLRALDAEAPLTLVYANNHCRGQSVDALKALSRLLSLE
jgi:uncharacterized protein YecE (DUF72 family)